MSPKQGRLVFRTGPGGPATHEPKRCKTCRAWPCRCEPAQGLAPDKQDVRVRIERSGRSGKTVTVVSPLVLTREDASALAGDVKRACGSGGTLKTDVTPDGRACFVLEIQGGVVDKVLALLAERGFRARRG